MRRVEGICVNDLRFPAERKCLPVRRQLAVAVTRARALDNREPYIRIHENTSSSIRSMGGNCGKTNSLCLTIDFDFESFIFPVVKSGDSMWNVSGNFSKIRPKHKNLRISRIRREKSVAVETFSSRFGGKLFKNLHKAFVDYHGKPFGNRRSLALPL